MEARISFSAAAALPVLRVNGRKPTVGTLFRWAFKGIVVGDRRVFLESVRVGGRRLTTAEAVQRFIDATDLQTVPTAKIDRRAELAAAEASCAAAGW